MSKLRIVKLIQLDCFSVLRDPEHHSIWSLESLGVHFVEEVCYEVLHQGPIRHHTYHAIHTCRTFLAQARIVLFHRHTNNKDRKQIIEYNSNE